MRKKTGGMLKGYTYSKKRIWINNGVIESLIFEDDKLPENFILGRLKTGTAWNKGLTKETDDRIKKLSEKSKKTKKENPTLKYTDDFLKYNYIDNNVFKDYWDSHGYVECIKHFHLSEGVIKRIIKLANLTSPREHSKKVKQLTYTKEWRLEHSNRLKGKNTWSKNSKHSKEHIEKQKAAYAKKTDQQKIEIKYKEHLSKIKNGTYKKHITKEELTVKNTLEMYFSSDDITYQYFDVDRYPFECDFYVTSLDLFIEVNAHWTHGGINYMSEDIKCQQQLANWEEKAKESKFYKNAIYTWTDLDVRKQHYAAQNKLFYLALYNIDKLEEFLKVTLASFSKVSKIKHVKCDKTPVYDISVPKYNNFVLENGLVVHNCVPYQYFKSTIYEKRLEMYDDRMLIHQIINLERNINSGKIDHPDGGCFTGDTKVKLVDGRSLSFLELVDEYNNNKTNYVYSMNLETNKIEAKPILKAWKTLENQPLVKLTFDNGEDVECTLNHRFMLRDGSYIGAQDLLPGDSLMPLYTKYPSKGGLSKYRLYVVSIEFIDKCEDVYDIEVADNHNFALAAGIFVHNSKDVCDAVCGSIFNASKHAEQFAYEYGESAEQLLQINENNSFSDDIKQLTLNMEEELKMINGRLKPDQIHPSDAQKKTEDYFMYDDIIIL